MITQAFILGAGLGKRLRPLTDDLPKPLVPVFQKRLITFALDQLIETGVETLHINIHHLPERFAEVFPEANYRGHPLKLHHEPILLETAGGIANIADELNDRPLLVYNGDILSDLPLKPLIETHARDGNLVTLALRSGGGPAHIALDATSRRVVDIGDLLGTKARSEFVFTGIYLVSAEFVRRLERGVKRSVIPYFLEAIRKGERIGGAVIDEWNWWDVGTAQAYLNLHRDLPALKFPRFAISERDWQTAIHATAQVSPEATIEGCSVIGAHASVGAGAKLRDTIVWPGAQIASRSDLRNCIVRSSRAASGVLHHAII
jgi:mannose-1-phosphate guanylyltransferase